MAAVRLRAEHLEVGHELYVVTGGTASEIASLESFEDHVRISFTTDPTLYYTILNDSVVYREDGT